MGKHFSDQGGVAASNPSPVVRWAVSKVLRRIASQEILDGRRAKVERARRKAGRAHVVEYFHQVDDGYSQLAAQLLAPLLEQYDIELVCHLVPAPHGANAPEPQRLARLSSYDAARIAPHYGLRFPSRDAADGELVKAAQSALAGIGSADFARLAPLVGEAAWRGDQEAMQAATADRKRADAETVQRALEAGAAAARRWDTTAAPCSITARSGIGAWIASITWSSGLPISVPESRRARTLWRRARRSKRRSAKTTAP